VLAAGPLRAGGEPFAAPPLLDERRPGKRIASQLKANILFSVMTKIVIPWVRNERT
jgi:hypothetical protein